MISAMPRPPHRSRPTAVSKILSEFVAGLPQAQELHMDGSEDGIRTVLGRLSTYCKGIRLADGHLLITTSVPAVAHHLRTHAPALLEQLRASGIEADSLAAEIV
jgi:hypothetical protein